MTIADLTTVLKLQVEAEPLGLKNLVLNYNGALGGWNWQTARQSSRMAGDPVNLKLIYSTSGTGGVVASYFTTEVSPIAPGEYAEAVYRQRNAGNRYHRARFEWYDADQVLVSRSAQTALTAPSASSNHSVGAVAAPATTAFFRLRIDLYDSGGGNPSGNHFFEFSHVTMATDPNPANLAGLGFIPIVWTDILGPTCDIKVDRPGFDLGILSATIRDTALDPATASTLRPGGRVQLLALNDDTGVFEPLFSGKTFSLRVTYDLTRTDSKQATIALVGYDAFKNIANSTRQFGVGLVYWLPTVLEGVGVPWDCDGSGDQVAGAGFITYHEGASAADILRYARDTVLGYCWVTKEGVVTSYTDRTADYYGNGTAVLDEHDYSIIETSFDTEDCVNEVTVKVLRTDPVTFQTTEESFGPYRDAASIREWDNRDATFTALGGDNPTLGTGGITAGDERDYADAILAANATPEFRVNAITVPINDPSDITELKALLDLYAKVNVVNTLKGINTTERATEISHEISPGRWLMSLALMPAAAVAGR